MAFWRLCPISLSLAQSYLQCLLPGLRHRTGSSPGPVPGPAPLRTAPSSAGTGRAIPRTGPQRGASPSPRAKSLPNRSNIAFHFPTPPSTAGVTAAWCRSGLDACVVLGIHQHGQAPHMGQLERCCNESASSSSSSSCRHLPTSASCDVSSRAGLQRCPAGSSSLRADTQPGRTLGTGGRKPQAAGAGASSCLLQLKQQPERSSAAAVLVLGLKSASCKGCS